MDSSTRQSATATQPALPAYLAYQGDGDVKAGLVYVNYGMKDDYDVLERLGVSVKGKIAIARYGSGWRGLKAGALAYLKKPFQREDLLKIIGRLTSKQPSP